MIHSLYTKHSLNFHFRTFFKNFQLLSLFFLGTPFYNLLISIDFIIGSILKNKTKAGAASIRNFMFQEIKIKIQAFIIKLMQTNW
jgi:hypothetical protein